MIEFIKGALLGDDTHLPQQDQWRTDILHTVACALVSLALGLWPGLILLAAVIAAQSGGGARLDRWIDVTTSAVGFAAGLIVAAYPWTAWPAFAALCSMLLVTAFVRRNLEEGE